MTIRKKLSMLLVSALLVSPILASPMASKRVHADQPVMTTRYIKGRHESVYLLLDNNNDKTHEKRINNLPRFLRKRGQRIKVVEPDEEVEHHHHATYLVDPNVYRKLNRHYYLVGIDINKNDLSKHPIRAHRHHAVRPKRHHSHRGHRRNRRHGHRSRY